MTMPTFSTLSFFLVRELDDMLLQFPLRQPTRLDAQMDEILLVPFGARDGRGRHANYRQPFVHGEHTDRMHCFEPVLPVTHDATLAHLSTPDLELRFDKRDDTAPGRG